MHKVILTGEKMLNHFSCFPLSNHMTLWVITSNNLEITPDRLQYVGRDSNTVYSDIYIKNNNSLLDYKINSDEIDYSFSTLKPYEYIYIVILTMKKKHFILN